jgi:hypothetical protein
MAGRSCWHSKQVAERFGILRSGSADFRIEVWATGPDAGDFFL